jgi:membrane-associated protease RseP (regulator of RpoE activity)
MLNDKVKTTTGTAAETPAQTAQPAEVPPTGSSRTAGWFSRGWRCGVAAAVIVLVAGVFFTIGWFTSTRGDHSHATCAKEISQHMDLHQRGFQQDKTGQQCPWQWQQGYPEGRFQPNDRPHQQAPFGPQAPSGQQAPYSEQAYLGVGVATINPALQQQYGLSGANGVLVASIDHTGPAFQEGIRRGDIITSIDETSVATREDVINLVAENNPGDSVSVVVDRDGQSLTFQVTLASRPANVSG